MSQVNRHHNSGGGVSGYFRSLEHHAGSARLEAESSAEFQSYSTAEMLGGGTAGKSSRRSFMKLAGASMAFAGITLTGCRRWPVEELTPYSSAPRDRMPGVPEHYATAFELGGIADGLIVTTYDGRPIKVEGNPEHPFALAYAGKGEAKAGRYGASTKFAQASVLEMYDPDRSRGPASGKGPARRAATIEDAIGAARAALAGSPVAVLSTATGSPSVHAAWAALLKAFPTAKWYEYEPLSDDAAVEGAKLAFNAPVRAIYDLSKASTIVSFDSDLLGHHPAQLRHSADWAAKRRPGVDGAAKDAMNRLFVAETTFSGTGAVADVRLPIKPSRMDAVVRALAASLGVAGASGGGSSGDLSTDEKAFVDQAASSLKASGNAGLVAAGCGLAAGTQAVAHLINSHIQATGHAVRYVSLPDRPTHLASITQLASDLKSGAVKGLIILSGNPAYDAPADLGFSALVSAAAYSLYFGLYENETALLCHWHVPEAHYLESWGDVRGFDGTVSLQQPMIEPLFGGKTKAELLALLANKQGNDSSGRTLSRAAGKYADDVAYKTVLQKGVVPDSAYPAATVAAVGTLPPAPDALNAGGMEFRFVCSNLYDGRFANLGWLIELPDGMTRLTWDNALLVSKTDANNLKADNGDLVKVTIGNASLQLPIFVLPGQPVGVAQLPLGWGRTAAGVIGNGNGFDTYSLRTTSGFYSASGSVIRAAGSYELASTQEHYLTDWVGRAGYDVRIGGLHESGRIVREATFDQWKAKPDIIRPESKGLSLQLWDPPKTLLASNADGSGVDPRVNPHAWGMSIDMSACTGCGACVVACQAENNIPTVGKHQVLMHRAMHWIRIDRYFKSDRKADPDVKNPEVVFMPMLCQHCENAPCEQVCPVAATVHDTEGLNTMVYNRCIGTRYCSNNCPYKVRRFNYFDYNATSPRGGLRAPWAKMPDLQQRESIDPIRQLGFNPNVSVRMRGVMEKCTYCTQRIAAVKIDARNEFEAGRRATDHVEDGSVLTACQQVCPTQAIVFGDMADGSSRVRAFQGDSRAYDVLEDLNTRPRTKYLGKLRNPASSSAVSSSGGPAHAQSKEANG